MMDGGLLIGAHNHIYGRANIFQMLTKIMAKWFFFVVVVVIVIAFFLPKR